VQAGIVIPSYKEAANIAALIEAVCAQIPGARVIVVDDSPDLDTVDAVRPLVGPLIEVVHRDKKDGRGSAVLAGIRRMLQAGCDTIVEMDADFSHAPAELPALVAALQAKSADMVIGSRYLPESRIVNWPLSRRLFSRFANVVARTLLRVPIHDYTNGYRVYSRGAAEVVAATCGKLGRGFIPLSEILVNLHYRGFRVAEVPSLFVNRARGESSVTAREIRDAAIGVLRIYGLRRRLMRAERAV
jgi:dolichol-phosphate mannosyltransferase